MQFGGNMLIEEETIWVVVGIYIATSRFAKPQTPLSKSAADQRLPIGGGGNIHLFPPTDYYHNELLEAFCCMSIFLH